MNHEPWILLDVSYLAYRAQFAAKDETDGLLGFISTLSALHTRFDSDRFVFCFDCGKLERSKVLPTYKKRSQINDHMEEQRVLAKVVMEKLRRHIVEEWGFTNIMWQDGYEADDIMASIIQNNIDETEEAAVIVSSDGDLWQLLSPNVVMYNPAQKELINDKSFRKKWNLEPSQWPYVKAIAGCVSDNIRGLQGVGDKTAAKYVAGDLSDMTAIFDAIAKSDLNDFLQRLDLVKLPYEGCDIFELEEQPPIDWRSISEYGATL